ncbi:MAG: hypothetical protein QOF33_1283 [Thermomicrobiales bacterium]|jgi:hypothetical protein|nr:hypothetical protein [Thermomicrobiales bacterium]
MSAASLVVRSLWVRAVRIPLPRSHPTAGGVVAEAPLVLVDLVTAVRRYLVE